MHRVSKDNWTTLILTNWTILPELRQVRSGYPKLNFGNWLTELNWLHVLLDVQPIALQHQRNQEILHATLKLSGLCETLLYCSKTVTSVQAMPHASIVSKCLHRTAPSYLSDLCILLSAMTLRSSMFVFTQWPDCQSCYRSHSLTGSLQLTRYMALKHRSTFIIRMGEQKNYVAYLIFHVNMSTHYYTNVTTWLTVKRKLTWSSMQFALLPCTVSII